MLIQLVPKLRVSQASKLPQKICFFPEVKGHFVVTHGPLLIPVCIFPSTSVFACTRFLIGWIKRYLEINTPTNETPLLDGSGVTAPYLGWEGMEEALSICSSCGDLEGLTVIHWIVFLAWVVLLVLFLYVLMSIWYCKLLEHNLLKDASLQHLMN